MQGTAQQIEQENKEYQKQIENKAWEALKTESTVAIKIQDGSWVLPYVAATFRNGGYEVSYNPDEHILTVRKDVQPQVTTE